MRSNWQITNNLLIILFLFGLLLVLGNPYYPLIPRMVRLQNTTEKEAIQLFALTTQKNIVEIELNFRGYVDGWATVNLIENGKVVRSKSLGPGSINESIKGDYYSDMCILEYIPEQVTEGRIMVTYRFKNI